MANDPISHPSDPADGAVAPPLAIVVNPRSGKLPREERLATIRSVLEAAGRPYELFVVDKPSQLPRHIEAAVRAAQAHSGILVACGGDGTINAVAHAAIEAGLPFGALPAGTFNFFARLHQLPPDPAEALRVVLQGRVHAVQAGLVNGRVFLVSASLGLYPKLLEDREAFKLRYGRSRLVAVLAGLATVWRERRRLALSVGHEGEGEARLLQTSTLFVGNNALQLESVGLPEARAVQAGRLAAVVVRPAGRWEMLGLALRGALGRLGDDDNIENFAFRRLDVQPLGRRGRRQVKVACDGEVAWMPWPLRFEVSQRPLRLVKPSSG